MRWLVRQLEQHAGGAFKFTSEFRYVFLNRPPVNADVLMTDRPHQTIELLAEGAWVRLQFHTHAWCGAITVEMNGQTQECDLYSEEHGFRELMLESGGAGHVHVVIRTGATPNQKAKANQVWLASIEFSDPQSWLARSRPVSATCTLTHGKHGTFLTLTQDTTIGASIVRDGVWAPKDVALFESIVKPGMTVFDVGANIGHHTVVYSKLVGPSGRVIAFEPQTTIFRLLAANAVMNGASNADLVQSCVGETEGFVHLFPIRYDVATNFGALGVDPTPEKRGENKGQKCRVARLDDLVDELTIPLERCDFIKIDVQSFELFVLRGAGKLLRKYRPVLFLEVAPHWMAKSYDYKEIYTFLWSLGYEIEHLSDPSIAPGTIKQWSGRQNEEWDILARPKQ